jgi:GH24 family phage-related lysozyme (muramidase)
MAVFIGRDMPKWEAIVAKALPNASQLAPDSFGALVSLAYNRGPSFSNMGDRYREMRAIRDHLANQQFAEIPDDIRSMKRLWQNVVGLRNRRDHEATLFEKGLAT